MDLTTLSLEELKTLAGEKGTALDAILAADEPTDEQVTEAEGLDTELSAIEARIAEVETAQRESAEKFAAIKERRTAAADGGDDEIEDNQDDEPEEEPEEAAAEGEDVEEPEEAPEVTASAKAPAQSRARRIASKSERPKPPAAQGSGPITITAAADVPEFSAGGRLDSLTEVAKAAINRTKGFPSFNPARAESMQTDGKPLLHKFGVASLQLDFPDELTAKRGGDDYAVVEHARNESRLEGESLVAAGGWCAPSETIYDLCDGETLDGIVSVPEINVARGGINYTSGPDFSDLYENGFLQTEAEAIAGTEKECYEVECPEFTEVRLDAIGLCITVPILTNAAYPELVRRVVSGSLIAHQHRINAEVISRMATLAGSARTITGLGSTVSDSLEALELVADQRRQAYRLGLNQTLEVILPFWVKGSMRSDLARRNGIAAEAVTDAQVQAHFAARNLNVQWAYDWQSISQSANVYPDTYQALVYPAGTFVKGVNDVINLSTVYDAASLSVNTYTGLFMEQGLLVAQTCYDSDLLTLPICNAGTQGALEFTCTEPAEPVEP